MKKTGSVPLRDDSVGRGLVGPFSRSVASKVEGADRHGLEVELEDVPLFSEPLRDQVMVDLAHKDFNRLFGVPSTTRHNPCSKPVSISPQDFPRLLSQSVMVADKSDGLRFQLMLGRWPDLYGGQSYALFVDEKVRFFEVFLVASKDYYNGTLLDGEVLDLTEEFAAETGDRRSRRVFLAYDALAVAGERVAQKPLDERLKAARETLGTEDTWKSAEESQPSFDLSEAKWKSRRVLRSCQSQQIVSLEQGLSLTTKSRMWSLLMMTGPNWDPSLNVRHKTDGLILTFVSESYRFGRNHAMLKVKFDHTIDLRVVRETTYDGSLGDTTFYFQDDEMEVPARVFAPDGNPVNFFLEPGSPGVPPGTSDIWECRARIDGYAVYLCPILRRDGKPEPNDRATVERTLGSIANPILPEHLYRLRETAQFYSACAPPVPNPTSVATEFADFRRDYAVSEYPHDHLYRDALRRPFS